MGRDGHAPDWLAGWRAGVKLSFRTILYRFVPLRAAGRLQCGCREAMGNGARWPCPGLACWLAGRGKIEFLYHSVPFCTTPGSQEVAVRMQRGQGQWGAMARGVRSALVPATRWSHGYYVRRRPWVWKGANCHVSGKLFLAGRGDIIPKPQTVGAPKGVGSS